ncbi:MAG: MarC family protein [Nanopusillaceae archaeon]
MDLNYGSIFVTMLIILGTLPNIFIFESIFDSFDIEKEKRKYAINKAYLIAYLVWFIIFLGGTPFLNIMGIDLDAFRIAGGIFLFYIAFEILTKDIPSHINIKDKNGNEVENIIVTPLAIPLITGPGVITTTLIYTSQKLNMLYLFLSMSSAFLVSYLIIYFGRTILEKFGKKNLIILNRLAALILLSISVQIVIGGITKIIGW